MNPIAAAFIAACDEELDALKPGNVHRFAAGHRMTVADFERSARAAAPELCRPAAPLGSRILNAVRATKAAVGQNTNLGIILLAAPLAVAAETGCDLATIVAASTITDAADVFAAISLAAPAGLGTAAQNDVHAPPRVTLGVAMEQASRRDLIALQWSNGFADVLGAGRAAYATGGALGAYRYFLTAFPDSHVVRKHGFIVAEEVRSHAARLDFADQAGLLRWDTELKARGINPGTSADLTVATAFAAKIAPRRL